jgi:C-terminal processing protease CtpA/Prc
MVTTCIPGFAAAPVLRSGDVVLSVVGSNVPITSHESLARAIVGYDPGQTVNLEIQRAGKVMRVPVRLSRRPFVLRTNTKDEKEKFLGERAAAVTDYWEKEFAVLLDPRPM